MEMFQKFESEFIEIKQSLEKKIQNLTPKDGRTTITQIRMEIEEAEQIVRDMDMSARNVPSYGPKLQQQIKDYRNDVDKMKTNLRKAEAQVVAGEDKESLFSGASKEAFLASSADQRAQVSKGTQKLSNSSQELKKALIQAEETQQTSIDVLSKMDEQTNTMLKIKDGLGRINNGLGRARKIMRTMSRRVATNKLILAIIILVIITGIVLVIWLGFFNGGPSEPESSVTSTVDIGSTDM